MQFFADAIDSGRELVLISDTSERVVKGKIDKQLWNLGLVEAYLNKFKYEGPTSCFRGRHQTYVFWNASSMSFSSATMHSFHFGTGDCRPCIEDFQVIF